MTAKDLRIGNLVNYSDQFGIWQDSIRELRSDYAMLTNHGAQFDYNGLKPIPLTEEWLLKFGFEKLPHFTVTHSIIKNIGRNRIISVGSVGTGNEMVWLCEIDPFDAKHITDLICIHNFDYDGKLMVHKLQNLHFALTGTELEFKLIKI